jgi:hypothetical protein
MRDSDINLKIISKVNRIWQHHKISRRDQIRSNMYQFIDDCIEWDFN